MTIIHDLVIQAINEYESVFDNNSIEHKYKFILNYLVLYKDNDTTTDDWCWYYIAKGLNIPVTELVIYALQCEKYNLKIWINCFGTSTGQGDIYLATTLIKNEIPLDKAREIYKCAKEFKIVGSNIVGEEYIKCITIDSILSYIYCKELSKAELNEIKNELNYMDVGILGYKLGDYYYSCHSNLNGINYMDVGGLIYKLL